MKFRQSNHGDKRKIHVTRQFLEAAPQGYFFEKKRFRYGLVECLECDQIAGLYSFSFSLRA